jgi:hypothetical protein
MRHDTALLALLALLLALAIARCDAVRLYPVEDCNEDPESGLVLCDRSDDYFLWLRTYGYWSLSHALNPLLWTFVLRVHLGRAAHARAWSACLAALGVWSLGWLFESLEELSFIVDQLSSEGANLAKKADWEPGDSLLGDPLMNALGVLMAVVFVAATNAPAPLPSHVARTSSGARVARTWAKHAGALVLVMLVADGVSNLAVSANALDAYAARRVFRADHLVHMAMRLGVYIVLWALNRHTDTDERARVYGRHSTCYYDALWAAFIGLNALVMLVAGFLWTYAYAVVALAMLVGIAAAFALGYAVDWHALQRRAYYGDSSSSSRSRRTAGSDSDDANDSNDNDALARMLLLPPRNVA